MTIIWAPQFKRQEVTILKEAEVFSGYCQVKQFQFEFPLFRGGRSQPVSREVVLRSSAAAVLLYDPDKDKVVMVEQFRAAAIFEPTSPWLLEIVAGLVDQGESPEEAAYREIKEETGCTVLSLIPICAYFTTPGISTEKVFIYCGRVKAPFPGENHGVIEESEDIKIHVFSTEEAFKLLQEGKVMSSPAVIALQWLNINQFSLRFPQ